MLLLTAAAWAQQIQLRVEPSTLAEGQTGKVRVLVAAAARGRNLVQTTVPPSLPTGEGLQVNYHGQMNNFRNINGQISRIDHFDFRLTALEEGTWTLGPVEVALTDGSTLTADAVDITVTPRTELGSRPAVSVDAGFDVEQAWEGQVVLYHYTFRSTIPGVSVDWRLPSFDGLRLPQRGQKAENDYVVDDPEGPITVFEGSIPLIATGTGKRDQGRSVANVKIPEGRPRPFSFRPIRIEPWATEPAELDVRPLPPAPQGFSGLVGDFELLSTVHRTEAAVGQSIGWNLRIIGNGALEGFSLPTYEADGVSIYENNSEVGARVDSSQYVSAASFDRVLVPTEEGTLQLPPFELITFSPTKGRYHTHSVALPAITARPGKEGNGQVTSFARPVEAPLADLTDAAPRAVAMSGAALRWPLERWLPVILLFMAAPGLGLLAFEGVRVGQDAWQRWAERRKGPRTAADVLSDLPTDPEARVARLDSALRMALHTAAPPTEAILNPLLARLQRARFADGEVPAELEADILNALRGLDSLGAT